MLPKVLVWLWLALLPPVAPLTQHRVLVGKSVKLPCDVLAEHPNVQAFGWRVSAHSNPDWPPELLLTKPQKLGRVFFRENGELIVRVVQPNFAGIYACVATLNSLGTDAVTAVQSEHQIGEFQWESSSVCVINA